MYTCSEILMNIIHYYLTDQNPFDVKSKVHNLMLFFIMNDHKKSRTNETVIRGGFI